MLTNLLTHLPKGGDPSTPETVEALLTRPDLRIERIVSTGQCTPPGSWYDQSHGEWVVVLAGAAGLLFDGEPAARVLRAGDCVDIAPHRRHRVEWTERDMPTIWLAVHYGTLIER
jgi:cupin 2 domain-containing protein